MPRDGSRRRPRSGVPENGGGKRRGSIRKSAKIRSPGCLFPVENNRWVVSIAGMGKNYPPNDEAGYMEALTKLRSPLLAEAVKIAEPISTVYSHRAMANRWRRYDRWPAKLAGFVALGDAACAFNPVYGQGMTTGALSALTLRDTIAKLGLDHPELTGKFYAAQAQVQKAPWGMATGADFAVPGCEGSSSCVESDLRSDVPAYDGVLGQRSGRARDAGQGDSHVTAAVGSVRSEVARSRRAQCRSRYY